MGRGQTEQSRWSGKVSSGCAPRRLGGVAVAFYETNICPCPNISCHVVTIRDHSLRFADSEADIPCYLLPFFTLTGQCIPFGKRSHDQIPGWPGKPHHCAPGTLSDNAFSTMQVVIDVQQAKTTIVDRARR